MTTIYEAVLLPLYWPANVKTPATSFDTDKRLCGWINKDTEQVKPEGFQYDSSLYQEYAFSGIHVLSPAIFQWMTSPSWDGKFSIMDFYLATCRQVNYGGYLTEKLHLIDIANRKH